MYLRPKARALVEALASANLPHFEAGTPEEARALSAALRIPRPLRPISEVSDHMAGGVAVRIYCDRPRPDATVVYFHGGGWVLGGLDECDPLLRDLAAQSGQRFVSVDYRLAPEAPFPCALEDADAVCSWVAERFGSPIFVMGESAGGNIATVCAMRARDMRGPTIDGQILIYPVTDAGMKTASYRTYADGPLLTAPLMDWFWHHYLPELESRTHPHASPLRGLLTRLPPALILTAEHDVLRDEGEAYAAALNGAGVPVFLRRMGGQIHSFLALDLLDETDGGLEAIHAFISDLVGKSHDL